MSPPDSAVIPCRVAGILRTPQEYGTYYALAPTDPGRRGVLKVHALLMPDLDIRVGDEFAVTITRTGAET